MQVTGRIDLAASSSTDLREDEKRALIGRKVGMVFQNPMTSLNPFVRIGRQLDEASRLHLGLERPRPGRVPFELLASVGIPDPAECYRHYPHQFSGGMKQRIMIATALAC